MYQVLGSDGKLYGPVDLSVLQQWCRDGRISSNTQIIDVATNTRISAGIMPELIPFLSAQARPPSGYQHPSNVYYQSQRDPNQRSRIAAGLLGIFLGSLGIHRFYLGYNGVGLAMLLISVIGGLLTCGIASSIIALWGFIEGILCLCGNMTDSEGRELGP